MGKEKVIANEEKGRRGPDKETASLMCRLSPRFQQKKTTKNSQKDLEVFVGPPPSPDVVLEGTPPLTDHVVCVVP